MTLITGAAVNDSARHQVDNAKPRLQYPSLPDLPTRVVAGKESNKES